MVNKPARVPGFRRSGAGADGLVAFCGVQHPVALWDDLWRTGRAGKGIWWRMPCPGCC